MIFHRGKKQSQVFKIYSASWTILPFYTLLLKSKLPISMFGKTRRLCIKSLYTSLTDPQKSDLITECYTLLCKALSLEGFMKIKVLWAVAQPQRSSYLEKKNQTFCSASRTSRIFSNYLTVHAPSLFLNNFTAIMCNFPDFDCFLSMEPKVDLAIYDWYPSIKSLTIWATGQH